MTKKTLLIDLTVDIVPKKNGKSAGITKSGRPYVYSRKAGKDSQNEIATEVMAQRVGWPVTDRPVKVDAIFRKRRGDCIGAMETLLDAMQGVIYVNDSQVWDQRARWDILKILPKDVTASIQITIL